MKISLSLTILFASILMLTGCQSTSNRAATNAPVSVGTSSGYGALRLSGAAAEVPGNPRYASLMAGVTTLTFDRRHGPQVSFYAPGGKIILWYPGNDALLVGEWKGLASGHECFRYGANTYNPSTRTGGGSWECQNLALLTGLLGIAQVERKGDVFGLAKLSKPPFVTRKDEAQFRDLFAKMPPQTADDRPSRKSRYMQARHADRIAENDKKIWEQVSAPSPETTPQQNTPTPTSEE